MLDNLLLSEVFSISNSPISETEDMQPTVTINNVVIEIESPKGFDVVSYDAEEGTKTYENGIIKFNVGTVKAKTLNKVIFNLFFKLFFPEVCHFASEIF